MMHIVATFLTAVTAVNASRGLVDTGRVVLEHKNGIKPAMCSFILAAKTEYNLHCRTFDVLGLAESGAIVITSLCPSVVACLCACLALLEQGL